MTQYLHGVQKVEGILASDNPTVVEKIFDVKVVEGNKGATAYIDVSSYSKGVLHLAFDKNYMLQIYPHHSQEINYLLTTGITTIDNEPPPVVNRTKRYVLDTALFPSKQFRITVSNKDDTAGTLTLIGNFEKRSA